MCAFIFLHDNTVATDAFHVLCTSNVGLEGPFFFLNAGGCHCHITSMLYICTHVTVVECCAFEQKMDESGAGGFKAWSPVHPPPHTHAAVVMAVAGGQRWEDCGCIINI